MKAYIMNQNKRLNKQEINRQMKEDQNITEIYKENFKLMVEEVFRDDKGEHDTKEMYNKITMLSDIK